MKTVNLLIIGNNGSKIFPPSLQRMNTTRVIIGYFTSWSIYDRKYFIDNIPADKITHINYAFAKIDSDGFIDFGDRQADIGREISDDDIQLSFRGNFNQLIKLKQRYPHLRTLISVGGYV